MFDFDILVGRFQTPRNISKSLTLYLSSPPKLQYVTTKQKKNKKKTSGIEIRNSHCINDTDFPVSRPNNSKTTSFIIQLRKSALHIGI